MEKTNISETLENQLPEIVKEIATKYSIPQYIENPDFLDKRLLTWHQFGLITHTKKVREIYLHELNNILKRWGLEDSTKENLNKEIDNIKKEILFEISIPLHDLGKIICMGDNRINREHEIASAKLLEEDFLNNKLKNYKLSEKHIFYIKKCIETHDVLGKELRDKLKSQDKLKLECLENPAVSNLCKQISYRYPDMKLEIGIFFLCDLLGKTDIKETSDKEINTSLREKNLPPQLKKAILQLPINLKLAEIYLKNIFN